MNEQELKVVSSLLAIAPKSMSASEIGHLADPDQKNHSAIGSKIAKPLVEKGYIVRSQNGSYYIPILLDRGFLKRQTLLEILNATIEGIRVRSVNFMIDDKLTHIHLDVTYLVDDMGPFPQRASADIVTSKFISGGFAEAVQTALSEAIQIVARAIIETKNKVKDCNTSRKKKLFNWLLRMF